MRRLTIDEFIARAKLIHNDNYDYRKVIYKNAHTKICIICKKYGEFWQTPASHLSGGKHPKDRKIVYKTGKAHFVPKAIKVHGDKYDYSKVEYVDAHTKVCIICKKHGEFWQKPGNHLQGRGCDKCAREKSGVCKRMSLETFILKASEKHNSFYNYDDVVYINARTKVKINCPIHGSFYQTPYDHLSGSGCPKCAKEKRFKPKEKFIDEANEKHNFKYNYDKVIYRGADKKITITCKDHGDFEMTPSMHLTGFGCPYCAGRLNTEIFIERCKKVHNNYFDYSKTIYTGSKNKVIITCPIYGDFEQMAGSHLMGKGSFQGRSDKLKLTKEEFITRAIEKHGYFYDYSRVNYINGATSIEIGCPTHGWFWQKAFHHLQGSNCPKCANNNTSKPEQEIYEFVKELYPSTTSNNYKIITPKELDIYIPELNKAIEFNGLYWHYSKDRFIPGKHTFKSNLCRQKGIRLLHVREDLWLRDKERMKEVILRFLKNE